VNIQDKSDAVAALIERRQQGRQGPLLEGMAPQSSQAAFALQQQLAAGYGEVIGWKCGLPGSLADGRLKWVVAPLFACELQQGRDCWLWPSAQGKARVEPEYAYPLTRAILPEEQLTEADIDQALGQSHLALELIQSRYQTDAEASFFQQLADGLFNQGLWLGPPLTTELAGPTELCCREDGLPMRQLAAVHPNQNPRLPLYWLVPFLQQQGIAVATGQWLITGSWAGVWDWPFGVVLEFGFANEALVSLVCRDKTELSSLK